MNGLAGGWVVDWRKESLQEERALLILPLLLLLYYEGDDHYYYYYYCRKDDVAKLHSSIQNKWMKVDEEENLIPTDEIKQRRQREQPGLDHWNGTGRISFRWNQRWTNVTIIGDDTTRQWSIAEGTRSTVITDCRIFSFGSLFKMSRNIHWHWGRKRHDGRSSNPNIPGTTSSSSVECRRPWIHPPSERITLPRTQARSQRKLPPPYMRAPAESKKAYPQQEIHRLSVDSRLRVQVNRVIWRCEWRARWNLARILFGSMPKSEPEPETGGRRQGRTEGGAAPSQDAHRHRLPTKNHEIPAYIYHCCGWNFFYM